MKIQMNRIAGALLITMLTAGCANMQGLAPQVVARRRGQSRRRQIDRGQPAVGGRMARRGLVEAVQ